MSPFFRAFDTLPLSLLLRILQKSFVILSANSSDSQERLWFVWLLKDLLFWLPIPSNCSFNKSRSQINIHHMHHPDSPNHHTPLNLSRTFSCQPLLVPLQSQMDYIPHHSSHKLQTGHEWDFVVQIQALRLHQHVANHSVSRQFSNFIRHFLVHCFHGTIQLRRKLILFFSPLRKTVTIFSFATDSFPSPASFSIHFPAPSFLLDRKRQTDFISLYCLHRFEGIFHNAFKWIDDISARTFYTFHWIC